MPAAFVPGLTGNMFAQFALVIAATALISAVNAATLKPTQCAMWLRTPVPPEQRNFFYRGFNHVYDPMERGYAAFIGRMVQPQRHDGRDRPVARGVGIWGLARLPTAFIPIDDQGYLMRGGAVARRRLARPHDGVAGAGHQGRRARFLASSRLSHFQGCLCSITARTWPMREPAGSCSSRSTYA